MTYALQQDMVDRYGEDELVRLTDRSGSNAINATAVSRALSDAQDVIDGYIAGRYTLPLVQVPRALKISNCDIARYFLYDDRATEQVTARYKDAIAWLKLVARGDVTLGPDASAQPVATDGGPTGERATRIFDEDTLAGFRSGSE